MANAGKSNDVNDLTMKQSNRMFGLDILRFVLAFGVMIFHFGHFGPTVIGATPIQTELGSWTTVGRFGVSVFFVVSGYVITLSVAGRNWRDFLWARTRRLMPALAVCASITVLVILSFESEPDDHFGLLWLKSLLFYPMIFGGDTLDVSYWSIAYEMQFYAFVALLLFFGTIRYLDIGLLGLSIAGVLLAFGFGSIDAARAVLFPYTSLFALGVLLATRSNYSSLSRWWLLFGVNVAFAVAMAYRFSGLDYDAIGLVQAVLAVICAVGLVVYSSKLRVPRRWQNIATVLGMISYPLYLLHQRIGYAVINGMSDAGVANTVLLPLAMGVVVTIAAFVAVVVEPQLSKARRQFLTSPSRTDQRQVTQ